jgi:hypothetical protein
VNKHPVELDKTEGRPVGPCLVCNNTTDSAYTFRVLGGNIRTHLCGVCFLDVTGGDPDGCTKDELRWAFELKFQHYTLPAHYWDCKCVLCR